MIKGRDAQTLYWVGARDAAWARAGESGNSARSVGKHREERAPEWELQSGTRPVDHDVLSASRFRATWGQRNDRELQPRGMRGSWEVP